MATTDRSEEQAEPMAASREGHPPPQHADQSSTALEPRPISGASSENGHDAAPPTPPPPAADPAAENGHQPSPALSAPTPARPVRRVLLTRPAPGQLPPSPVAPP